MISSIEEFVDAKEVVLNCSEMLTYEKTEHNSNPKIGMMVELPSVVGLIEDFAEEADFFSIGTNDFIQFMLGVDRTNENVESFYVPHHPSVLRGIARIVAQAVSKGKEVTVCGDMAHDRAYIKFLLGIGIRTLSIEPTYMPKLQKAIEQIDLKQAEKLAEQILVESTFKKIANLLDIKNND
jgi:phosphotransferase system enzyme I (PtsP)